MIDVEKELTKIFRDPLFADVTAPKRHATRGDRLTNGFIEVCDFYERTGREPHEDGDANERRLYNMLKGIRLSEEKTARCREHDSFGLLGPDNTAGPDNTSEGLPAEEKGEAGEETPPADAPNDKKKRKAEPEDELDRIFGDPLFADMGGNAGSIFDIPEYMRQRLVARKEADYIGSRRPCDDFVQFAAGFAEIHEGLAKGRYRLVKFCATHLKVGRYFVEQGVMGFLAAFSNEGKNSKGSLDGRTRVIYENGSEADLKFQTIVKNLSADGYSVQDVSDVSDEELQRHFSASAGDVESGTIYVLRSKSQRPEIASVRHLFKIGFTTTSVESRIANARREPTYLCADVEVVATWKVYNVKASTLETLIHRLFADVQLQVTVDGHRPEEWYVVPLPVIKQAMEHIVAGREVAYDSTNEVLVTIL